MTRHIFITALALFPFAVCGQLSTLNGLVADSATLKPLANVTVRVKNNSRGVITNHAGYFSLSVHESDSILISFVGYRSLMLTPARIRESAIIYLKEQPNILRSITFAAPVEMPSFLQLSILDSWKNVANEVPYGVSNVQTFGVSKVFKGVFSRYNKYVKERKRLPELKSKNKLASAYMEVVTDPGFKREVMNLYDMTEERYFKVLEEFNKKYSTEIYQLGRDELTSLLHIFYAEQNNR